MSQVPRAVELSIRREALDSPAAQRLIAALNAELAQSYPEPGANHFRLEAEEVGDNQGALLVGYRAGEAVACGAVRRIEPEVVEIKRMYVVPAARGCGFSRCLLRALEQQAVKLNAHRLVLETGTRQKAAIALYRSAGFFEIECFGEYAHSALSICMAKDISHR